MTSSSGKSFVLRLLLLVAFVGHCANGACTTEENMIWARRGPLCTLYRNRCYFDRANSQRQSKGLLALNEVSKEECQKFCPSTSSCITYGPVCAKRANVVRSFDNLCVMYKHSCQTGEPWIFHRVGLCEYFYDRFDDALRSLRLFMETIKAEQKARSP